MMTSVINTLGASLTHDARVVINDCHMFIVPATEASIAITATASKAVIIAGMAQLLRPYATSVNCSETVRF